MTRSLIAVSAVALAIAAACGGDDVAPSPSALPWVGGRMVDVGAYELHIECQGSTPGPTVILMAGLWVPATTWIAVQPRVQEFARVCTYDRAGVGTSEQRLENHITDQDIIEELHTILRNADVQPPYVLAGHSIAGLYIRLYRERYPDEVTGLVFLDGSHEDQLIKEDPRSFGDEGGSEVDLSAVRTDLASAAGLGESPVIALHGPRIDLEEVEPDFPEMWLAVHTRQAQLSTNSMLVIASTSGHYIQETQPDVAVEAIRLVVAAARDDSTLPDCETAFAGLDVECPAVPR